MLNLLQSKCIFVKGNIKFVAQSGKIVLMQQMCVKLKDYCSYCTVKAQSSNLERLKIKADDDKNMLYFLYL